MRRIDVTIGGSQRIRSSALRKRDMPDRNGKQNRTEKPPRRSVHQHILLPA
jgi:hypothetical protein